MSELVVKKRHKSPKDTCNCIDNDNSKCKKHRKVKSKEIIDNKDCLVNEKVSNIKHIREIHVYPVDKIIHTYQTQIIYHKKEKICKKIKLEPEIIHCIDDNSSSSCSDHSSSCSSHKPICPPEPPICPPEPPICPPEPPICPPEPPICHPEPPICHPEPPICHPEPPICKPKRRKSVFKTKSNSDDQ
jgi:hypothetical protein